MHRQKNQKFSSRHKTFGSARTKVSNYGGVYPIPIYTKPSYCGGNCIYCPKSEHLPNSYIQNEDTAFALNVNYSPERQLIRYIQQIEASEGYGIPLEIIILGGSFSSYTKKYRKDFISRLYNCMQELHLMNKESGIPLEYLCSILTVESRPDQINKNECNFLRRIGVSKVEIGVQHVSDTILKKVNRGHSVRDVIKATYLLKSFGFKVGYHVMIGLPGSTHQDDVRMLKKSLWKPELSPDFLKIYPCELLKKRTYQHYKCLFI